MDQQVMVERPSSLSNVWWQMNDGQMAGKSTPVVLRLGMSGCGKHERGCTTAAIVYTSEPRGKLLPNSCPSSLPYAYPTQHYREERGFLQ